MPLSKWYLCLTKASKRETKELLHPKGQSSKGGKTKGSLEKGRKLLYMENAHTVWVQACRSIRKRYSTPKGTSICEKSCECNDKSSPLSTKIITRCHRAITYYQSWLIKRFLDYHGLVRTYNRSQNRGNRTSTV